MNARLVVAVLFALLAAGAVAAAIMLGLPSGSSESAPRQLEPGEPISVVTSLSPPVHRLGDLAVARLELTVDPRLVDPARVQVSAQFAPYELARDVEVSRSSGSDGVGLQFTYELQCLGGDCANEESSTRIELPQAVISYRRTDTNLGVELRTSWPTATLVARVGDRAGSVPAEATLDALPETTYSIAPDVLRGLAIGLATLLVAAVLAWVLLLLRPTWRQRVAKPELPAESHSLGGALAQLVDARGHSVTSQRLALEALARELDSVNGRQLAPLARQLAWSRGAPGEAELDALLSAANELEGTS